MFLRMLALSLLWTSQVVLAAPAAVEILRAEFGVFEEGKRGEVVFEPSAVVPHRVGQRYGWVIEVRSKLPSLAVSEEYLMPMSEQAKADSARDPLAASLNVMAQPRHQVSQRQLIPRDGQIYGEWSVGPSEPAGHRQLQVLVEGQVAARFEFDMKPLENEGKNAQRAAKP